MIEGGIKNNKDPDKILGFSEVKEGNSIRFTCILDEQEVGSISLTPISDGIYTIGGLFVDPKNRGKGISSQLVKTVNEFLDKNHAVGKLVNTIKGDSAIVYENNKWVKGEFKSQGAYGGYEYIYDASKN